MTIPYEDDITKTQLWQKIDDVFPVIANIKDELYPQILGTKQDVQSLIKIALEDNHRFIEEYDSHLHSSLIAHTREVTNITEDTFKRLNEKYLKHVAALEEKIRESKEAFSKDIETRTKAVFTQLFAELSVKINNKITEDMASIPDIVMEQTRAELTKTISKVGEATGEKITNLRNNIPSMIREETKNYLNKEYEKNIERLEQQIRVSRAEMISELVETTKEYVDQKTTLSINNFKKSIQTIYSSIPDTILSTTKTFLSPVNTKLKEITMNLSSFKEDILSVVDAKLQTLTATMKDFVRTATDKKLEDHNRFLQNYDANIQSKMNQFSKQIEKIVMDATDRLSKQNIESVKALEEKIRVMQASIPSIVKKETQDYLAPTNTRVSEMSKELDVFKTSLLQTTGKLGTELTTKISDLHRKLDETLKKFRSLSSAI